MLLFGSLMALSPSGVSGCHAKPSQPSPSEVQSGRTEPTVTDAGKTIGSTPSGDGGVATKALPGAVLDSIAGCWQLEDRERWAIERAGTSGARVVRTLLDQRDEDRLEYAKRAALPADILFNAAEHTLAFSTAGPTHALLFVFTVSADGLQGNWATSHAPAGGYHWLAGRVSLQRCADETHAQSATHAGPH